MIETEGALLRATALASGHDAAVPTCPGWTVQRLVGHTARVLAKATVTLQAADPATAPPRTAPPEGDFDAVLAGYDERLAALLTAVRATDPSAPAWNFSPTAPKTAAFWSRRMAHECTVHRIDAEAAVGRETAVGSEMAADGIDEVLTRLIQRWTDQWSTAELVGTVLYHAADAGRAWAVRFVPGQIPQTAPEAVAEPNATVVGLADAVYRTVWGRPSRATVTGNLALLRAAQGH